MAYRYLYMFLFRSSVFPRYISAAYVEATRRPTREACGRKLGQPGSMHCMQCVRQSMCAPRCVLCIRAVCRVSRGQNSILRTRPGPCVPNSRRCCGCCSACVPCVPCERPSSSRSPRGLRRVFGSARCLLLLPPKLPVVCMCLAHRAIYCWPCSVPFR